MTDPTPNERTETREAHSSDVFSKERSSQILVNLHVTHVPRCTISNAKKLGLNNPRLSEVAAGSEIQMGHALSIIGLGAPYTAELRS
jgi:hypothetical protein